MSARRAGWIAATMWVAGLAAFVFAVVLADLNPPISTVQEPESAV